MAYVPKIPPTGAVGFNNIVTTFGRLGSGQGYTGAGPVTNSGGLYYRYGASLSNVALADYYGMDPAGGVIPSSGTIRASHFRNAKPSAKFYLGYENPTVGIRRYGFGNAFSETFTSQSGTSFWYLEGSRFLHPEVNSTSGALGSISHRNLMDTGTNNLWITGIQAQAYGDTASNTEASNTTNVMFLLYFESTLGGYTFLNSLDASFNNVNIKIGSNSTIVLPFSSNNTSTTTPKEGWASISALGLTWRTPPKFRWNFNYTAPVPSIYNQMKYLYHTSPSTPCYIWLD